MIGKLNHSMSESSLGEFYDGGYTEAVVGYAYRPVRNDRLNALAKYTYFYNVPTTGSGDVAEHVGRVHPEEPHRVARLTYDLTTAGRSAASTRTAWGR